MIKFIKTKDETNEFDLTDVIIQSKESDLTVEELCAMFKSFLQACTYSIDSNEEIEIVEQIDVTNTKELVLDLTDAQFNTIATIAHDNDMTLNEMVNHMLVEEVETNEYLNGMCDDEDAISEFNDVVEKLEKQDEDEINREFTNASEGVEQMDLFDDK